MTKDPEDQVRRVVKGVKGFAAEMKAAGIHLGMGNPGRCVTCGEMWPCKGSEKPKEIGS